MIYREMDREEIVCLLLKTKKQIQHLSYLANVNADIKEICECLREICEHERISDWIDVDVDKSIHIEYCPKCETTFKPLKK
jgi:RNase P subunit RPR2